MKPILYTLLLTLTVLAFAGCYNNDKANAEERFRQHEERRKAGYPETEGLETGSQGNSL